MLKLYNTRTKRKEPFKPLKADKVGLYTCGPTVYNYAHVGNLRSYVFADLLKRTLLATGYKVKHVMNITDVGHLTDDADQGEDKMEKGAKREGKTAWEIAKFYTDAFKKDLAALNILEPDIWSKATDHIKEQIALVQKLEKKGYTYKTSDGIYFDTSKFKDYGVLVGKKALDGLKEGARIAKGEKKNQTDFALWKLSPPLTKGGIKGGLKRQMEWNSPWGKGFPGWHIECSAMSMKYLGETFDIHTGGIDHIPIHHTNEIAQSEAATGKMFARYWMHGEFLVVSSGRMGKSEGNFIPLYVLVERGYSPLAYRYFLLQTHYRKQLVFRWDALEAAEQGLANLVARIAALQKSGGDLSVVKKVKDAFSDDINTPQALAALWAAIKSTKQPSQKTVFELDALFGLDLKKQVAKYKKNLKKIPAIIQKLVNEREKARQQKDFKAADDLREKIAKSGWSVDDAPQGPILYPKK